MYAYTDLDVTGSISVSGSISITQGSFSGSGLYLYDVPGETVTGYVHGMATGSSTASMVVNAVGSSSLQIKSDIGFTGSMSVTGGIVDGTASWALTASSVGPDIDLFPKRFNLTGSVYTIKENFQANLFDIYNYGTININSGSLLLTYSTSSIRNDAELTAHTIYNGGIMTNSGIVNNI